MDVKVLVGGWSQVSWIDIDGNSQSANVPDCFVGRVQIKIMENDGL